MRRILSAVFATFFFTTFANANTIDVLSESHHLWGHAGGISYNVASDSKVAKNLEHDFYNSGGEAGNYSVLAYAADYGNHYAESNYIFTTDAFDLSMRFYGFATQWDMISVGQASISLFDLSSDSQLFYQDFDPSGPPERPMEFDELFSFTTTSDHLYELTILASADATEGINQASINVELYTATVPEPSTMLLMATGLAGLGFAGRKKKQA